MPDVATPSTAFEAMELERRLPRALMGGTRSMQEAGTDYLPQWEGESDPEYRRRLSSSVLVNFYAAAVRGAVDDIFAEPLDVEGLDPEIQPYWDSDIDLRGTTGDLFFREVALDAMAEGISHAFADFLPADGDTRADEELAGARPYLVHMRGRDTIEALPVYVGGRLAVGRLRWRTSRSVLSPKSEWEWETISRILVYRKGTGGQPATFEIWEKRENTSEYLSMDLRPLAPPETAPSAVRQLFSEIPITEFSICPCGFYRARPPFLELAELNESHWRKLSNKDNAVDVATVPMLHLAGFTDQELGYLQWGPFRTLAGSDTSKVTDISFKADGAVTTALADLQALEMNMAMAALEPKISQATGEQKATVRLLDEAQKLSRQQAWALMIAGSIERSLRWMHRWIGQDGKDIVVKFDEEVFKSLGDAPKFEDLLKLSALGKLSTVTLLEQAKRFNRLPDDLDVAQEMQRIEQEMPRPAELEDMGDDDAGEGGSPVPAALRAAGV